MIIDITGVDLIPGLRGKDCLGNGTYIDEKGNLIECCCDECDYLLCCMSDLDCNNCDDIKCPRSNKNN